MAALCWQAAKAGWAQGSHCTGRAYTGPGDRGRARASGDGTPGAQGVGVGPGSAGQSMWSLRISVM